MAEDEVDDIAAFQRQMLQLASFARSSGQAPLPEGLAPDRAMIYRQLFLNNIGELLTSTLPLTRAQVSDPVWRHWVSSFYSQYPHSTPYFMEIAGEFVEFLNSERETHEAELPAWAELAHYEWVQLAISVDADAAATSTNALSNLLAHAANGEPSCPADWLSVVPVLSPVSAILAYEYPVHEVTNLHAPAPTLILVYRDNGDRVQRMLLSPMAAQLLDAIQNNEGLDTGTLLESIGQCHGQPLTAEYRGWALQFMYDLALRGVLWGAVP